MEIATGTNLLNTNPDRIRKAVMQRFSPLDGIGKDLTIYSSYDYALRESGLGFTPRVARLYSDADEKIEGYKAIFNGDKLLSVVKDDYTVVSNAEAFSIAEDLVDSEGFTYTVSNIQKNGARCRLILSGPTVQIAGEDFTPYAVLNNSFDLSRSISVQFMFLRMACLNGILRRGHGITSSISLTHFGEKDTKLKRLSQFRTGFSKSLDYLKREAEALRNTPFTKEEFRNEILPNLISHVFQRPDSTQLTERQQSRTQAFIESVLSAYDAEDTSEFNGTAYKVMLTMTDLDSHLAPFVNRSNPDVYINRVLQTETIMSMANYATNYIISTRKIKI